MKTDKRMIDALNELVKAELTGINQYIVEVEMKDNWGFSKLSEASMAIARQEMGHLHKLVEHIIFLEGIPNVQRLDSINIGQTIAEQLDADLKLELAGRDLYNQTIKLAEELGDNGTAQILRGILTEEEEHINFITSKQELVQQAGLVALVP